MMLNQTLRFGKAHIRYDHNLLSTISMADFRSPADSTLAVNQLGRASAYYVTLGDHNCVLKRYHRGGLIRHLTTRYYFYSKLERTRMWEEYTLLQAMLERSLPVPRPVAALCELTPAFPWLPALSYTGSLITQRIDNASTLGETLNERALSEQEWRSLGQLIRQFHDAQVFHADLNASNILWQANGNLHLIDFDKSRFITQGPNTWKQANLQRLRRSLEKLNPKYFIERGWLQLLAGYT